MGIKSGAVNRIAGTGSRTSPRMSITKFTNSKKVIWSEETLWTNSTRIWGSCSKVINHPSTLVAPITTMTIALVTNESTNSAGSWLSLKSRYMITVTKKPYTTATAAASVGVTIPPKIPPRIRTGIKSAGADATNASHSSLGDDVAPPGSHFVFLPT